MSATLLVGAVLTFASTDASALNLTVSSSETATASLTWGDAVFTSTVPARRRTFGPLPTPIGADLEYTLRIGRAPPRRVTVKALPQDGLRIALYGDSRDGHGPHRGLLEAVAAADPHVIVHTGDVVHRAGEDSQWAAYLSTSLPVSARIPVVLALGNHELWQPRNQPESKRVDALAEAMAQVPPPEDPIARANKTTAAIYHVRIGRLLIVAMDSNTSMARGSPQLRFLDAVVAANPDTTARFAAVHHGPASSGKHGPHRHAEDVIEALERLDFTASFGGHDHTYERIERGSLTYLVSGGGGAPLYKRRRVAPGSVAFASTYNWSLIRLEGETMHLSSFSLEGVLLDRAQRPLLRAGTTPRLPWSRLIGAAGLLLIALILLVVALVRGPALAPRWRRG